MSLTNWSIWLMLVLAYLTLLSAILNLGVITYLFGIPGIAFMVTSFLLTRKR